MLKGSCASQQIYGNRDVEELTVNSWSGRERSIPEAEVIQAAEGTLICFLSFQSLFILQHVGKAGTLSPGKDFPLSPLDMFVTLNCQ